MLYLIKLGVADWVQGTDHTVQHGPTPPPLDIELVEERESVTQDLAHLEVPPKPTREFSHLSLILRRLTIDTATPSKKAVSLSSFRTQGVFMCIPTRYGFPMLV
jgi:hypothetical protein